MNVANLTPRIFRVAHLFDSTQRTSVVEVRWQRDAEGRLLAKNGWVVLVNGAAWPNPAGGVGWTTKADALGVAWGQVLARALKYNMRIASYEKDGDLAKEFAPNPLTFSALAPDPLPSPVPVRAHLLHDDGTGAYVPGVAEIRIGAAGTLLAVLEDAAGNVVAVAGTWAFQEQSADVVLDNGAGSATATATVDADGIPNDSIAVIATFTPTDPQGASFADTGFIRLLASHTLSATFVQQGSDCIITATVRNAAGAVVQGKDITFAIATGQFSDTTTAPKVIASNAQGQAAVTWQGYFAGDDCTITSDGALQVIVDAPVPPPPPSPPDVANVLSGNNQSAQAGGQLAQPLMFEVLDGVAGPPIPGLQLGYVSSDVDDVVIGSPVTDANGRGSITVQAGARVGTHTVTAQTLTGAQCVFSFTVAPSGVVSLAEPFAELLSTSAGHSFSRGPFSAAADAELLVFVGTYIGGGIAVPDGTLSGGGLTWVKERVVIQNQMRLRLFRARTGVGGSITLTFDCTGADPTNTFIGVVQGQGVDAATAIRQIHHVVYPASSGQPQITLPANAAADSGLIVCGWGWDIAGGSLTGPAGWTKLVDGGLSPPGNWAGVIARTAAGGERTIQLGVTWQHTAGGAILLAIELQRAGTPAPSGYTLRNIGLPTASVQPDELVPYIVEVKTVGGAIAAGVAVSLGSPTGGSAVITEDPAVTTAAGEVHVEWTAPSAPGIYQLPASVPSTGDSVVAEISVISPLPPGSGQNITPVNLRPFLGTLSVAAANPPAPIGPHDSRFAATERARYDLYLTSYLPVLALTLAHHYGFARSRMQWAIRHLEPYGPGVTDTNLYRYARGRRVVKDYLTLYSKPNNYAIIAHNNTGMLDIAALYVLEGDIDAYHHLHVNACQATVANDYVKGMTANTDVRIPYWCIEALAIAEILQIPYVQSPKNSNFGVDPSMGSWKACANRVIGFLTASNPRPWLGGASAPWVVVGSTGPAKTNDGAIVSPANNNEETYIFNTYLACKLLRFGRYVDPTMWTTCFNLAKRIIDHQILAWEAIGRLALPYLSGGAGDANRDLAGYFIEIGLILYQETGQTIYRDFALGHMAKTNGAFDDALKQFNQKFSTGGENAEALDALVAWS